MIKILLYGVEIVASFLLILVILAQRSKGSGGLGGAAFGGMGESIFGSRAGNVLTKATIVLGSIFLLNTLALTLIMSKEAAARGNLASSLHVQAPAVAPGASAPAAGAQPAGSGAVPVPPGGGAVSVPVEVSPTAVPAPAETPAPPAPAPAPAAETPAPPAPPAAPAPATP